MALENFADIVTIEVSNLNHLTQHPLKTITLSLPGKRKPATTRPFHQSSYPLILILGLKFSGKGVE